LNLLNISNIPFPPKNIICFGFVILINSREYGIDLKNSGLLIFLALAELKNVTFERINLFSSSRGLTGLTFPKYAFSLFQ